MRLNPGIQRRTSRAIVSFYTAVANLATGLIKDAKAEVFKSDASMTYSYLAAYGPQSLAEDNLGIAVIYPTAQLTRDTEDELSHIFVFDSNRQKLSYYFLAAWEQEKDGIQSILEIEEYLQREIAKLSSPLEWKFTDK